MTIEDSQLLQQQIILATGDQLVLQNSEQLFRKELAAHIHFLINNDFEKLVKDTANAYYDDSKWFLANCYMRTNRNSKARKLLQEISNSNSIHRKEAFGLLQEQ